MPLLSFLFNNEKTTLSNHSTQSVTSVKNKRISNIKRSNNKKNQYYPDTDLSNWTKTSNLLRQLADILTPSKKPHIINSKDLTIYDLDSDSDSDSDSISLKFTTTTTTTTPDTPLNNGENHPSNNPPICDLFTHKGTFQDLDFASVTPCSMDINSIENPIKFETLPNGTISAILSNNNNNNNNKQSMQTVLNNTQSSNNNTNPNNLSLPISPQSNNSPSTLDDKSMTQTTITSGATNNPTEKSTTEPPIADEPGLFICHYCDATFRIRGYLTRHIKKHAIEKAYHCPFYDKTVPPELRCHNSGGFSRRDTYKTHLKARHFTFPSGIKAHDRNKSDERCSHCGEHFMNADDWINNHLETGKCVKLPEEYLIKLREKSKVKGRTHHKLKMIKTSTGHSRYVSSADSVIEQKVLQNKEALEAIAIVAGDSLNNHVLSKNEENQFVLNSENFEGHKRPKKKYRPRKNKQTTSSNTSKNVTNYTVGNTPVSNSDNKNQVINGVNSFVNSPSNLMVSNAIDLSRNNSNLINTNDSGYVEQPGSLVNNSLLNTFTPITATPSISSISSSSSIFLEPLDIEQQSIYEPFEEINLPNIPNTCSSTTNNNNNTLNMNMHSLRNNDVTTTDDNLYCNKVNEIQMRETKQYLNFYNFLFSANL